MQLYAKENKGDNNRPTLEISEEPETDFANIKFSKTLTKGFRIESHKHSTTTVREMSGDYRSSNKLLYQLPTKNSFVSQTKPHLSKNIYGNFSNEHPSDDPFALVNKKKSIFTIKPKQDISQATQLYFHSPQIVNQKSFKIGATSPATITKKRFYINPQPPRSKVLDF